MENNRFGRLVVTEAAGVNRHGARLWNCLCDCGNKTVGVGFELRAGHKKSCGCLKREWSKTGFIVHGQTVGHKRSPTYMCWHSMLSRCYQPSQDSYKYYGGRGVQVCQRWRDSFPAFLEDMGVRPNGMTLDRRDSDGNYEPGNCRWATATEQSLNRRMKNTNTSGATNVQWRSRLNRWLVVLSVNGKKTHFGHYVDFELAALVASEARRKHYGIVA